MGKNSAVFTVGVGGYFQAENIRDSLAGKGMARLPGGLEIGARIRLELPAGLLIARFLYLKALSSFRKRMIFLE